jgi:predicted Ser/Thr protein kinase
MLFKTDDFFGLNLPEIYLPNKNKIDILRCLGHGVTSTVFEVEYEGRKVAAKVCL